MNTKTQLQAGLFLLSSLLLSGCSTTVNSPQTSMDHQASTFGNSENINIISNPTMMFHDIIVSKAVGGAQLVGKVHVMSHQDYVPGHIDIVAVDKKTGETISVVTTDFNGRIARHGRYNIHHANNIFTHLPGVDPDKSVITVAYHHSNVNRFSKIDCGANVALVEVTKGKVALKN